MLCAYHRFLAQNGYHPLGDLGLPSAHRLKLMASCLITGGSSLWGLPSSPLSPLRISWKVPILWWVWYPTGPASREGTQINSFKSCFKQSDTGPDAAKGAGSGIFKRLRKMEPPSHHCCGLRENFAQRRPGLSSGGLHQRPLFPSTQRETLPCSLSWTGSRRSPLTSRIKENSWSVTMAPTVIGKEKKGGAQERRHWETGVCRDPPSSRL